MDSLEEMELKETDYGTIMDRASSKFKSVSTRFGDPTTLCRAYVDSILQFTKERNIIIKDGKIFCGPIQK